MRQTRGRLLGVSRNTVHHCAEATDTAEPLRPSRSADRPPPFAAGGSVLTGTSEQAGDRDVRGQGCSATSRDACASVLRHTASSQRPSSARVMTYNGAPSLSPPAEWWTCRTLTAGTSGRTYGGTGHGLTRQPRTLLQDGAGASSPAGRHQPTALLPRPRRTTRRALVGDRVTALLHPAPDRVGAYPPVRRGVTAHEVHGRRGTA